MGKMNYKNLIKAIQQRLDKMERSINDEDSRLATLEGVWANGRDIYTLTRETGKKVYDIAFDIGIPEASLQKYLRFYRVYSKGYAGEIGGKPISWSHYAAVLYVGSKKIRDFYLRESAKQGWSSRELRRRKRDNYYENRQEYSSARKHKAAKLKTKLQKLYTYSAQVLKVVDADTFDLDIDIGFRASMKPRVRLRGINCPEAGTKKGEKARAFVEDVLGAGGGSASIVEAEPPRSRDTQVIIRSYKIGKFGRYIVDLWYLKGETDKEKILEKGRLLNQALLDEGLAEKIE